jgi:hypothetical protein
MVIPAAHHPEVQIPEDVTVTSTERPRQVRPRSSIRAAHESSNESDFLRSNLPSRGFADRVPRLGLGVVAHRR